MFGHQYIAPVLGAGTPNLTHNGYQVTNAAGNLVDENGNELDGAYLSDHPGFPGFGGINASQTLAYMADMQEAGVPVTYGYIADIHGNALHPRALVVQKASPVRHLLPGSGSPCYVAQAQYYNQAFSNLLQAACEPTASRRRTRCSCSALTRATTRQGPTSVEPSSRRRQTATAPP